MNKVKNENVAAGVYLLLVCLFCIAALILALNKDQGKADLTIRVVALEEASKVPVSAPAAPLVVRQEVSQEQVTTIITTIEQDLSKKYLNYAPTADCISVSEPGAEVVTWSCRQR